MRILGLVAALAVTFSLPAAAQAYASGYIRSNGTYVESHWRSSPDHNPYNNYSYPGNINPHTGATATGDPSTYLQRYYSYPRYRSSYRVGSSSQDE